MVRDRGSVFALAVAAAALAACTEDPAGPGIAVSVDLAGFEPASLKVAISAKVGGFDPHPLNNVMGIGVESEDVDGDGVLELVVSFIAPRSPVAFRIKTDNEADLMVAGQAIAFDAAQIIAGAESSAESLLPAGGRGTIALTLAARPPGPIGPNTRSTDLKTASPDISVGTTLVAKLSAVAVCDVDADQKPDLVIGAPQADGDSINTVGAVYVVLGANGLGSTIDLSPSSTLMGFDFFGEFPGDQLGAALACADLDGDGDDDLIVGSPGADLGAGRVYVVFGSRTIRQRPITPGSTGGDAPDVTLVTTADMAFGKLLSTSDVDGDGRAEILAASSSKVHLFTHVLPATGPINVDAANHPTFANIPATSLAAGDLKRAGGIDVVIGDSEAKLANATMKRGAIYAFASVMPAANKQYDALSADPSLAPSMVMYGGVNSAFGAAVLALNTTGPGQDLVVGAPGEGENTGAFYIYEGDTAFFAVATPDYIEFARKVVTGPAAGGRFGSSLAGTPTGTRPNFDWDLLVGAPATGRSAERPLAGAAYLFGGGSGRFFPLLEQVFGANTGDQLGSVVAGGQVNPGPVGDLVIAAPGVNSGTGAVYVRFNHFSRP
jgi:FG-GAP repeat protein